MADLQVLVEICLSVFVNPKLRYVKPKQPFSLLSSRYNTPTFLRPPTDNKLYVFMEAKHSWASSTHSQGISLSQSSQSGTTLNGDWLIFLKKL